jgi:hypothetical protein
MSTRLTSWVIARSVRGFSYDVYGSADRVAWLHEKHSRAYMRKYTAIHAGRIGWADAWAVLERRIDRQLTDSSIWLAERVIEQRAELAQRHEPLEVCK